MDNHKRCVGLISGDYRTHRCQSAGKYSQLDGGPMYCGTHFPPNVKKRREKNARASAARYKAKNAERIKGAYEMVARDLGVTVEKLERLTKEH